MGRGLQIRYENRKESYTHFQALRREVSVKKALVLFATYLQKCPKSAAFFA